MSEATKVLTEGELEIIQVIWELKVRTVLASLYRGWLQRCPALGWGQVQTDPNFRNEAVVFSPE